MGRPAPRSGLVAQKEYRRGRSPSRSPRQRVAAVVAVIDKFCARCSVSSLKLPAILLAE